MFVATNRIILGNTCPVIPKPASAVAHSSGFVLNKHTVIVKGMPETLPIVHDLQRELLKVTGIPLVIDEAPGEKRTGIKLDLNPRLSENEYTLTVNGNGISIAGGSPEAVFHGMQSFLQLIDYAEKQGEEIHISGWSIKDRPANPWRGIMLDESRHFFGKEKVKWLLDWMAYYKLNKFHWHLTDQPAWRIEIKKYPKLGLIGGVGNHTEPFTTPDFYTQDEIAEIVSYAAERFITVIPEIDMPGHAGAANRAYPEFSGGGTARFPDFTFNPGKDSTYQFLTDILREVDALFPSQMMHLGGDEVHFGIKHWQVDAHVQQLMKQQGFSELKEVEHYFMERMADSVRRMGNELLVWDEASGMNLPLSHTVVFWWRQDKPQYLKQALDKGYRVVLCPRFPLYLDYQKDTAHIHGPKRAKVNGVREIYSFRTDTLYGSEKNKQILGIQANIWTERIKSENRLGFMVFPRIAAVAETAWVPEQNRTSDTYPAFEARLKQHVSLYEQRGVYYYDPFRPAYYAEPIQ